MKKKFFILTSLIVLLCPLLLSAQSIPTAVDTITGEDGSVWERVSDFGFGNKENLGIVALTPFQNQLYVLTRNESTGFELWRTSGTAWEQVSAAGFTDGTFHEFMNNGYGEMIEFDGYLYVAVGSGYEGAYLYKSVGLEIWRFDGTQWEPVISNSRDEDEAGTITGIDGCAAADGDITAVITDSGKAWESNQWAGGVLRITSGSGKGRVFDIVSNTATALTIQQNEESNTDEYTVCGEIVPDEDHTDLVSGAIVSGDAYAIGIGDDENGFGEMWNKNFIDFEVFNGELFASIAHNYEDGTRIWKTADGLTWEAITDYSFGLFHGFDPDGSETGMCLIDGVEDRNGAPVCSSSTYFAKTAVDGTETLYVGGTGSSGCNGRGARVLKYENGEWNFIVDYFVDDNDEGTNENGLGDAGSFLSSNFQAWSWADYDDKLFVGVARPVGSRVMYTDTGDAEDGAWKYAVGGDAAMPDGFDGVGNFVGYGANLGSHMFAFDSALYAGTMANNYSPALFAGNILDGADIWRATGPAEALVWTRITSDGFGDKATLTFGSFCTFGETLYVGGSNLFGNFSGDQLEGYKGGAVYRLKEIPVAVVPVAFTAVPEKTSVALSWQADNETDIAGYNVYRSTSEKNNTEYKKVNSEMINAWSAPGQTANYEYTDSPLWFNTTYFYKIEAVDNSGNRVYFGPLPATTKKLFGN